MTEQEILDKIPKNWLASLQKDLNEIVEVVASQFTHILAEDLGLNPDNAGEFWLALAKKTQVTTVESKIRFSRTCLENAKMELFRNQYPELIAAAEQGRESISQKIMDQILGDTDKEVRQALAIGEA
ncbi:MAG: hypothetical protein COB67_12505 [SAR324 cluster bacterium]|uniref:Uncharacterized protein n=1 Tax=SAR324 cluster bacterium TaxID=2024889 RepID=A0A2A4SRH2_9DELT|nr:MAG: hypothetical protein COB67_12505 [SAR324 cluster bacterium]